MKALILAVALLSGCANIKDSAHLATGFDAATTAIGVGSGVAAEVNPLIGSPAAFVAVMLGRVAATEYVNTMAEPQRTEYLSAMSSVWWGIGASNLAILAFASNPVGIVAGLATGMWWWHSTTERRQFAAICAAERITNPALVCEYKPA